MPVLPSLCFFSFSRQLAWWYATVSVSLFSLFAGVTPPCCYFCTRIHPNSRPLYWDFAPAENIVSPLKHPFQTLSFGPATPTNADRDIRDFFPRPLIGSDHRMMTSPFADFSRFSPLFSFFFVFVGSFLVQSLPVGSLAVDPIGACVFSSGRPPPLGGFVSVLRTWGFFYFLYNIEPVGRVCACLAFSLFFFLL